MEPENESSTGPDEADLTRAQTVFLEGKVELCEQIAERHAQEHAGIKHALKTLDHALSETMRAVIALQARADAIELTLAALKGLAHTHPGMAVTPERTAN